MEKDVTIKLAVGLEARPIALIVQTASQYDSAIYLETGGKKVNAKSIMGMMSLSLKTGDVLTVRAEGSDEAVALEGMVNYLSDNK